MEELTRKICTGCGENKSTRSFDISPRTHRTYPRCKECRLYLKKVKIRKSKKFLKYTKSVNKTKRRCIQCNLLFIPSFLYQKTCTPECEKLWNVKRKILREAGPIEIVIDNAVVLLDADDYEWARFYEWQIDNHGYVYRMCHFANKCFQMKMANEILEPEDNFVCDHINHVRADNRKENLRICTQKENLWNMKKRLGCRSKYKGVGWHDLSNKWRAYICPNGHFTYLGLYDTEEEAALAYDEAAKKHYGEYACLNFPEKELVAAS